jgi:DNA polymerase-1
MILQVHDELVLECVPEELTQTVALVQQVMADAYPLRAALQTEARYGQNWGQMNPVPQAIG